MKASQRELKEDAAKFHNTEAKKVSSGSNDGEGRVREATVAY